MSLTIYNAKQTAKIVENSPILLDTFVNRLGQTIKFYEHPIYGENYPVIGEIDGVYFDTEFFETDDMTAEHGEYTPGLHADGSVWMGYEVQ